MTAPQTELTQRVAHGVGYAGSALFGGMTLAEIELVVRIGVGLVTIISLAVGIALKIRAARKK